MRCSRQLHYTLSNLHKILIEIPSCREKYHGFFEMEDRIIGSRKIGTSDHRHSEPRIIGRSVLVPQIFTKLALQWNAKHLSNH